LTADRDSAQSRLLTKQGWHEILWNIVRSYNYHYPRLMRRVAELHGQLQQEKRRSVAKAREQAAHSHKCHIVVAGLAVTMILWAAVLLIMALLV